MVLAFYIVYNHLYKLAVSRCMFNWVSVITFGHPFESCQIINSSLNIFCMQYICLTRGSQIHHSDYNPTPTMNFISCKSKFILSLWPVSDFCIKTNWYWSMYTYMSGFMKTVPKNWNRGLSGRFLDDIKIKRKVSLFFLPLPVYLPFIALLSLFFSC